MPAALRIQVPEIHTLRKQPKDVFGDFKPGISPQTRIKSRRDGRKRPHLQAFIISRLLTGYHRRYPFSGTKKSRSKFDVEQQDQCCLGPCLRLCLSASSCPRVSASADSSRRNTRYGPS